MSLRSQFFEFDDVLTSHGVRPLTEWWRDGIGKWLDAYEQGQVLELYACVGRGAAKSTALYKLALFFTLFGEFEVPPGERHYAVVLSRLKEEAAKGIAIISRWLHLLGVPHRLAGDVVELNDAPQGIRVVAASVSATSGWRAFFVAKDERSKWPSGGTEDMDASEIDTSAAAMTATHPLAPIVAAGSAWGDFGAFYEAITSGTDATKVVIGPAPTWVAAPHITEESLRKKEPDPKKFAREFRCEFGVGAAGALDVEALRRCIRNLQPESTYLHAPEIVIDSSGGKHDSFIAAVFAYVSEPCLEPAHRMHNIVDAFGRITHSCATPLRDECGMLVPNPNWHEPVARLCLMHMVAWEGAIAKTMTTSDVADRIAAIAKHYGAHRVHGDQYGAWSWSSDLGKRGLVFEEHPWNSTAKTDGILRLRQLIREEKIVILPSLGREADAIVQEATTFEERIMPSGVLSFGARGRAHDDRIMTLLLAARVDAGGRLRGSPISRSSQRYEIHT